MLLLILVRLWILYQQVDKFAFGLGFNPDGATVRARLDTMVDGVFHLWLQCERGNGLVLQAFFNLPFQFQAVAQAQCFDGQVTLAQSQFPR